MGLQNDKHFLRIKYAIINILVSTFLQTLFFTGADSL